MSKRSVFPVLFMAFTAGIAAKPVPRPEDARVLLNTVTKALGAEGLKTLHYTGTGSSYIVTDDSPPPAGWTHTVMKSYVHDLNLEAITSRVQLVRAEGTPPADRTLSLIANATSPWSLQHEFWITPYGFLKGAMMHNATVEPRSVFGTTFRCVTFTLPGEHQVVGYINDKDLVEKVETWIGEKGDRLIEAYYRDYTDFNGVKVPTMITQKHAGTLSLILIAKEVRVGK
ncbi:MAG TPA: hypothetical protein VFR18_17575 [Terriglobia bacterium]|nr:hypothetical protein [Terriglobia bacterium]